MAVLMHVMVRCGVMGVHAVVMCDRVAAGGGGCTTGATHLFHGGAGALRAATRGKTRIGTCGEVGIGESNIGLLIALLVGGKSKWEIISEVIITLWKR